MEKAETSEKARLVVVDVETTSTAGDLFPTTDHFLIKEEAVLEKIKDPKGAKNGPTGAVTCPLNYNHTFICNLVKHTNYVSPLARPYHNEYTFDRRRRGVETHRLFNHNFHHQHRARTPRNLKSARVKSAKTTQKNEAEEKHERSCTIL
jgi:hypothetical protein